MFYNFANTSIALSIHYLHSKAKKASKVKSADRLTAVALG